MLHAYMNTQNAGGKRTGVAKLRRELERFHKDPPDHIQVVDCAKA
jgi:hypothetical protein